MIFFDFSMFDVRFVAAAAAFINLNFVRVRFN